MPSLTFESFEASDEQVREYYYGSASPRCEKLDILFEIAMRGKWLFPPVSVPQGATFSDFIDRWQRKYMDAHQNPPSLRVALPKGAITDPALRVIVQTATGVCDVVAGEQEASHSLFMSAENVLGSLLEEYIDSVIHDHGWIWCEGSTLRAVDFCSADGSALLQVKNKFNSENSSSSKVRVGTPIQKWYRLASRVKYGMKVPYYRWPDLNKIVESTSHRTCVLSEADYITFIMRVVSHNRTIITAD
jgi:hypothetical protein